MNHSLASSTTTHNTLRKM